MAGHGSPPAEDRAHHPGRKVSRSPEDMADFNNWVDTNYDRMRQRQSDRAISQRLQAAKQPTSPYPREKEEHDYRMGRLHDPEGH